MTNTLLSLRKIGLFLFVAIMPFIAFSQCEKFDSYPEGAAEAKKVHVLYRDFMKEKKFADAKPLWEKLYASSPAGSEWHYIDGIKIYKDLFDKETDEAKKKEINTKFIEIYDGYIACYGEKIDKRTKRKKIGYLHYRKGKDLYYMGGNEEMSLAELKQAQKIEGFDLSYSAIAPLSKMYVREFNIRWNKLNDEKKELPEEMKNEGRDMYNKLIALADTNIVHAKDEKTKEKYQKSKTFVEATFVKIENAIFDCEYFKAKWMPEFEANKNDPIFSKDFYLRLRKKGCDGESDAFVNALKVKYEAWAVAENIRKVKEAQDNNPRYMGRKAFDAGDYPTAISYYQKAVDQAEPGNAKAKAILRIAKVYQKQGQKSKARSKAREAAAADPSSGQAYMFIGKLYAGSGSSCKGSDPFLGWAVSWAAVDQFAKARSVDPSLASEANQLIGKYSAYFPPKTECFMRGLKAGSSYTVGCWIGASTSVRFKK